MCTDGGKDTIRGAGTWQRTFDGVANEKQRLQCELWNNFGKVIFVLHRFFLYHVIFCEALTQSSVILRAKIEAIIKKPGLADPDCPQDAASMRGWCSVGGKYTGKELTAVSMKASANVAPSGDALTSLLGGAEGSGGEVLALANTPSGADASSSSAGCAPSMEQLVALISAKAKAKSKAKAKAKAKANPAAANASTVAEQREQFRTLVLFRLSNFPKDFSQNKRNIVDSHVRGMFGISNETVFEAKTSRRSMDLAPAFLWIFRLITNSVLILAR